MACKARWRTHRWLAPVSLISFTLLPSCGYEQPANSKYPFVAQKARNNLDHYICLGLAGAMVRLEEGTEIGGTESSEQLVARLWTDLTSPSGDAVKFRGNLRLRDGAEAPTCSKAAIEEIGALLHEQYEQAVHALWRTGDEPEPGSRGEALLLATRQKYDDLRYKDVVSSETALRRLCERDKDGLVALCGTGSRSFEKTPPQNLIVEHKLQIDALTGKYPPVPSLHVFLIECDENRGTLFVHDSNDPSRKWRLSVHGSGDDFAMSWEIDDYLGHGPARQVYDHVRPLDDYLRDLRGMLDATSDFDRQANSISSTFSTEGKQDSPWLAGPSAFAAFAAIGLFRKKCEHTYRFWAARCAKVVARISPRNREPRAKPHHPI